MSIDRHLQEKIYRLETLRKYQAYYGPNTPPQIIAEINQVEAELRRMLKADVTRPTKTVGPRAAPKPKPAKKKRAAAAPNVAAKSKAQAAPAKKTGGKASKKQSPAASQPHFSTDMLATVAFIGLVFLLGAVVLIAFVQTRSNYGGAALAQASSGAGVALRPTFTPTADPNNPDAPAAVPASASGDSLLPPAHKEPTQIPTPVPTLTPSPPPNPTDTPTPPPTDTPVPPPTQPPAPPPPPATPTPSEPPPTPAPSFPFAVSEQGNRMFQGTSYHVITIYAAIVSDGNLPIGGLKLVADHTPSGRHVESGLSDWNWSVTNCLDCDYVKFGNAKLEPGTFEDGIWNIYVADEGGNQLSAPVPLSYSADPAQWVWDFIIFKKN